MSENDHSGTPESYLIVPKKQEVDINALSCVLSRAYAVCLMLSMNYDDGNSKLTERYISDAIWALEGLIEQAQILTLGKEK